ncbi:hypothetical protein LTR66_005746 [Elasticomyces elasticus]|nr:hypothetical protein LTR66_005746 [Elasticomyces elasticus]
MFKKKPTIKALSPLRSSDRRKTADAIIADYQLSPPSLPDDATADEKAAATAAHTTLRASLLPENTQSARFTTTHGPDLKPVSGTLYVGSHNGSEPRILWVKIDEKMYPTVYTLWQTTCIVPLLHTHGVVVEKLQGGADLMTPGLANGPPFPEKATKGSVIAIASREKPTVPVVVGVCLVDVSGVKHVHGAKGAAVQTVHWMGDELWAYSTSGKGGKRPPEELDGWRDRNTNVNEGLTGIEHLDLEDEEEDGGVPLDETTRPEPRTPYNNHVEGEEATQKENGQADGKEFTISEIDEAFRNAFLYGIYHHKTTQKSELKFGLTFPISQSFVMSDLIQPFLPAFTPEEAAQLQIKKSSYKNLKKFIKSLDKQGVLKSKERDGHETTVVDIDFEDQTISDFKPYPIPKKETQASGNLGHGATAQATASTDAGDSSVGQKLRIITYHRPKEKLANIFSSASNASGGLYTSAEIRPIITSYIESENIVSLTNKRLVQLNPSLANAVFDGSSPLDKEVIAKGSVPRDALIDRIVASCSPFYAIVRNDASDAKTRSGGPPKIRITLETRSGNKKVTKISGLEAYFIPPQPLADELRKVCAGSTSVERLEGSSPRAPVMEIMVQGPQKDAVVKALEKRGVQRNWIETLDKTKGKKK